MLTKYTAPGQLGHSGQPFCGLGKPAAADEPEPLGMLQQLQTNPPTMSDR